MSWYERDPLAFGNQTGFRRVSGTGQPAKSAGPVSPLEGCLNHYVKLDRPGYAVLVTGPWGSGKTHQIDRIFDEQQRYYVSLFGVTSVDEAKRLVFAKMFPTLGKIQKFAGAGDRAGIGGNGVSINVGAIPSTLVDAFIADKIKTDRVLILDDLERAELSSQQLLSVVNFYVEHKHLKVVVLSDYSKLRDDFKSTSEKVFGRIIHVEPETEDAFDHFIGSSEFDKQKKTLIENRNLVLDTFAESKIASLRILRFALDDVCRCLAALTQTQLSNKEHTQLLMRHLLAFSIEARAGNLKRGDFTDRRNTIREAVLKRLNDRTLIDLHPLEVMNKNYSKFDATDMVVSDDILESLLVDGYCDPARIVDWTNQSPYFLPTSDVRPWKILWNSRNYEYQVVEQALQDTNLALENFEITDPGELLHVFALKQDLLPDESSEGDREQLLNEFKGYVDKLSEKKLLPELWPEQLRGPFWRTSYAGYQFMISEATRAVFDRFLDHLNNQRSKVLLGNYPEFQSEILDTLATNAEQFSELVAYTSNSSGKYLSIPVLCGIPPADFVRAWLACPKDWDQLSNTLERRYEAGRLPDEYEWLDNVVDLMETEIAKLPIFRQRQLRHGVPVKIERVA